MTDSPEVTQADREAAAEIVRLRALCEKLVGYAAHDDNCEIVVRGVWSDPIPCTCGFSEALDEYRSMTDD